MKMNNLGYLLKEGLFGVFRHGFMSFAAVCVTVACLLIVGSFSILLYNINLIVEDLNKTNEVVAYIDETLSDSQARSVGTKINQVENVYKATFMTREEALQEFIDDHEDEKDAFSSVVAEDLRHRIVVTLEDGEKMEQTVKQIKGIPGVADVKADYVLAKGFSTMQQIVGVISVGVNLVLLVVSLLIISNTVKLALYDRREEIAIMKMVGATDSFIRLPFVVEGFLLGMLGASIAFFAEWSLYDALVAKIHQADTLNLFEFVPFETLLTPMVLTFGAAGLFVGIVGSWTSIRKFLNV